MSDKSGVDSKLAEEVSTLRGEVERLNGELLEYKRLTVECDGCEARYRAVFDNATDGMHIMDIETRKTLSANKKFFEMTGYDTDELALMDFTDLFPREHTTLIMDHFEGFIHQDNAMARNIPVMRKDGMIFTSDIAASPVLFGSTNCLVSIYRDTTERNRLEGELKRLATTDSLTQTFNRAKFYEIIGSEIERASRFSHPLSILLFDIDNFKAINDTFGHSVGDTVLKKVADIVKAQMRKVNYLIRWGGEEFLVVAIETDLDGGVILAERVREAIEENDFDTGEPVTISLGVAEIKENESEDELVKRADDALYSAKKGGKNMVKAAE